MEYNMEYNSDDGEVTAVGLSEKNDILELREHMQRRRSSLEEADVPSLHVVGL
jgi:hypothetical protein